MPNVWFVAAFWVGLALVATLLAIWFRVSTALAEIVVGTVAQLVMGVIGGVSLGGQIPWISFLPVRGTGHEVETIVTYAKEDRFDLLLAGYHGHSRIFERVMGSTAQSLVRLSPCSVLLAK